MNRKLRYKSLLSLVVLLMSTTSLLAAESQLGKPRLVVNIVVGQLRAGTLESMSKDFHSENGFNRFLKQGVNYTESRFDYMQTTPIAGLATIASGTNPQTHGLVTSHWVERTTNQRVNITYDEQATGLDCDFERGKHSAHRLVVPTLSDALKSQSPKSKSISIAFDASHSIVMGGNLGANYWMDLAHGTWISSSKFMPNLPAWLKDYNAKRQTRDFLNINWKKRNKVSKTFSVNYSNLLSSASGNLACMHFAQQAVIYEDLGVDDNTDLLNIYFSVPSNMISELGVNHPEVREMLVELDAQIDQLVNFITAQISSTGVIFVLSSNNGSSDTVSESNPYSGIFDPDKYRILANAFLSSWYGSGEWVVGYNDRQIYLNHNLIYQSKLPLSQLQESLVAFTLQFRGVAQVYSSTALQNNYFAEGMAALAQRGFSATRAGDLTINLQVGWIEANGNNCASSGSGYDYDRHVPLIFMGSSLKPATINRAVSPTQITTTLAHIMQINPPQATSEKVLEEITKGDFLITAPKKSMKK